MTNEEHNQVNELAKALFIVNRHAKTAPNPRQLYALKKQTISKLLNQKKATKVGLHFSDHPKLSHQHSTLLIKVSDYYFHIPPSKEDFKTLKHLGNLDENYRNPKPKMSLTYAKKILSNFLGIKYPEANKNMGQKRNYSSYFTPSSLGQLNHTPRRNNKY
ncbi:YkyB family protein [Aquibacillus koreensis]|uniref:YkyB family protein n=1 Tax=Aquibacillus koreensis TaxID=279446 RepID=A0A9X4AJP9_9BACI|nr:YkyB family protein [Aquibacillus koreensis]MCT2534334.1 YkyB family protein [Aquibacillus koreensis]MDC3420655.1 YkyB family protein [Aquibacillus koreensis]